MAGEWIKVELCTPDKPEILRMSRLLGIDKDAVFGKLIRLWAWFDKNSVDGVVDGCVDQDIDAICYHVGFCSALVSVGWITIDLEHETVSIPKFDRHNGESAKKRALKTEAQAKWRSGVGKEKSTEQSTNTSTTPSTREEKRRVNNKADIELPSCISKEVWDRWIAYRKERRIACATGTLEGQIKKLVAFSKAGHDANAILEESISNGWQGIFEPKTAPKAATVHQLPDFMRGAI